MTRLAPAAAVRRGLFAGVPPKEARILEAALDLFVERGFHGTTVPDLARRARLAAGTIYLYFPGKEEVVNALIGHLRRGLVHGLEEGVHAAPTIRSQFDAIWDVFARFVVEQPRAASFLDLHYHAPYVTEDTQRLWDPARSLLDAHFRAGRREHVYRDLPPGALRAVMSGVLMGAAKFHRLGEVTLTRGLLLRLRDCAWAAVAREGVAREESR